LRPSASPSGDCNGPEPGAGDPSEPAAHPSFLESRDAITRFLFLEDEPQQVDLCLVLGSPSISSVVPAIDLFKRGFTPRILISGHGPSPDSAPEWRLYRDYAIGQGVPAAAILVEEKATNTLENFTLSARVIEAEIGWSRVNSVAIAAKPFHMRRALMTARANWPAHVRFVMRPSNAPDDPPAATWWQTESGRGYVLSELRAIGTYALAGHIGGF
jgi:hypothetical protein